MLSIMQIGNGSAFNYKMTNSSFLIKDSQKKFMLLFDCGESVFAELRRKDELKEIDLNMLTDVFISHMDGDHIGSLKTLIYYMYFIRNKVLRIWFSEEIEKQMNKYLEDINGYKEFGKLVEAQLFVALPFRNSSVIINYNSNPSVRSTYVMIMPIKVKHGEKPTSGLVIQTEISTLIITGDTEPVSIVEDYWKNTCNKKGNTFICFHDYSNFNSPDQQVHACETTMEYLYSKEIRNSIIPYHDDRENFPKGWFDESDFDEIIKEFNYNKLKDSLQ